MCRQQRASQARVQLFKGCSIYINGYTDPPTSDLRRMILEYGGDYQHYLKKISVTHIIATNLTNSKIQEFRTYKVVKPEWITESVEKGELQSWQNYRLVPRSSKQKELVFQTNAPSTDKNVQPVLLHLLRPVLLHLLRPALLQPLHPVYSRASGKSRFQPQTQNLSNAFTRHPDYITCPHGKVS